MLRDSEPHEDRGGEDARLDIDADRHDGAFEFVHAQLAEGFLIGGIGPHHVGEFRAHGLHDFLVKVDAEHIGAGCHQFPGDRLAEPTQSDDDDGVGLSDARRHLTGVVR